NTAYTYAVDLQADEAVAAGAEHVELSAPASYFLENFIGAPVGTAVPAGTYDYEQGLWLADPDGRVVQLVSITGGLADLDINGDGGADSASSIEAIGITEDERAWLATRYAVGAELWHTEIHHFSVVDLNNMKGCPWCEGPPELPIATDDACSPQKRVASVVECTNQTFGEDVPVAGTPYSLHYRSDRVPGRAAARRVIVPITDDTVSAELRAIIVRLHVAGRHLEHRVECPCAAQDSVTMEWDGLDVFGRLTHGHQPAWLELGYEYSWASFSPAARGGWAAFVRDVVARPGARRGRRAQHRGDPLAAVSGPRPLGQRGARARAVLARRRAYLRQCEPHLVSRGRLAPPRGRRHQHARSDPLQGRQRRRVGQLGAARRRRADEPRVRPLSSRARRDGHQARPPRLGGLLPSLRDPSAAVLLREAALRSRAGARRQPLRHHRQRLAHPAHPAEWHRLPRGGTWPGR
ncbi:MAG: hypothetical protein IPM79_39930, partial [Polyangiaceae bacterium]|nr:hypothetical protein [Polyangiaceae bacterium]